MAATWVHLRIDAACGGRPRAVMSPITAIVWARVPVTPGNGAGAAPPVLAVPVETDTPTMCVAAHERLWGKPRKLNRPLAWMSS